MTGHGTPDSSYTATVTGTWPDGTTFDWAVNITGPLAEDPSDPVTYSVSGLTLTLNYVGGVWAPGTVTATVTATGPLGSTQTLGPITFTLYPY